MNNLGHLKQTRQNSSTNRFKALFLGLLAGIWLNGCTSGPTKPNANMATNPTGAKGARSGKKVILTTFTVLADMAQNVAGDKAIVESITKPGSEVHG